MSLVATSNRSTAQSDDFTRSTKICQVATQSPTLHRLLLWKGTIIVNPYRCGAQRNKKHPILDIFMIV